jgi:transcriptional regulator with XRE-family HTH domain
VKGGINVFAKRLVQLREEHDWTQQQVADKIGVSRSTYAHYELGRRSPDQDITERIMSLYGVSEDFLKGRTNVRAISGEIDVLEEEWGEVLNVLRRAGRKPTTAEKKRIAKIIEVAIEDTEDDD